MANGLSNSPMPLPERLPLASDQAASTPVTLVAPANDEHMTATRKFVTAFMESIRDAQIDIKRFSLAVYFMPEGTSAQDCMDHYQQERESQAISSWSMPKSYATSSSYIDYRDLLLLVQPHEHGSLTFGPGLLCSLLFLV